VVRRWSGGGPGGAALQSPGVSPLASLEGARVLVTGASSGIGAATAEALAGAGAEVGLAARRTDRLEAVRDRCAAASPGSGDRHRVWSVDLSDPERAAALARDAWDAFGGLDALVNNAAVPRRRHVADLTVAEVEEVMRTNFASPVAMSLAVLPLMLERGAGVIVNVASLAGRLGVPTEAAYAASKFALCGWSESMALDLWDDPVEVRLVNPGAIDTEIWDRPGNDPPVYEGELEPPGTVARAILDALTGEGFERYVPDLKAIVELKTTDIGTYLRGAAGMAADTRRRRAARSTAGPA